MSSGVTQPTLSTQIIVLPVNNTNRTQLTNIATLSGGGLPTGSISFFLYASNDPNCVSIPIFTSPAVPVNGNGIYSSPTFTVFSPGTYNFIASYSGDANNPSVTVPCGSEGAQAVVLQLPILSIRTYLDDVDCSFSIFAIVNIEGLAETANFANNNNQCAVPGQSDSEAITGILTFRIYGPNDVCCTQVPVHTSILPVYGNGSYESQGYTPCPSDCCTKYRFIATYIGNNNNITSTTVCGDRCSSIDVPPREKEEPECESPCPSSSSSCESSESEESESESEYITEPKKCKKKIQCLQSSRRKRRCRNICR